MSLYYYFVAGLPSLSPDQPAPITTEGFLAAAETCVSRRDYRELEAILTGKAGVRSRVASAFTSFRQNLVEMLAEERAKQLYSSAGEYEFRGVRDSAVLSAVKQAVTSADPLEGEMILMKAYWKFLDSYCSQNIFSFESVCVYAIKLSLITRTYRFDSAEGKTVFGRLFTQLQTGIENS